MKERPASIAVVGFALTVYPIAVERGYLSRAEAIKRTLAKLRFFCSYNPSFADSKRINNGWVSLGYYGLDQGPIVAMIENYRTGFLWRLLRNCPYIAEGLRRAGFKGGWLSNYE